ncbi:hypothetical protein AB0E04_41245 [Streptomyces sp. NPDC048251]|uniref:hypothetical protein n=1 Tax=Streptomyces sp. NPDC048251 TaxID=3154501 RepID=UPI00341DEC88
MQSRAQLFDSRQQVRREAYAAFFSSVEQARAAMGSAHSVWTEYHRSLGPLAGRVSVVGGGHEEAREAVREAVKALWFQQSLLRLSVTGVERQTADSLVGQVVGVMRCFEVWCAALERGDPPIELDRRFMMRSGELADTVVHVMETAKGWLDGNPELDPPRQRLWQRFWSRYHDRRFRSVDP